MQATLLTRLVVSLSLLAAVPASKAATGSIIFSGRVVHATCHVSSDRQVAGQWQMALSECGPAPVATVLEPWRASSHGRQVVAVVLEGPGSVRQQAVRLPPEWGGVRDAVIVYSVLYR